MRVGLARGSIALGGFVLFALALTLALGAGRAQGARTLQSEHTLATLFCLKCGPPSLPLPEPPWKPPPEGQIEGACGLAVASDGDIYVSDYHHRLIDVFSSAGIYQSQIAVGTAPEGPCGLAIDSTGALYANVYHQRVVRLKPSLLTIDTADSTGVAVDAAGNVYANARTYVAKYEAPLTPGEEPVAKIGLGSLGDGFGLAVFGGRVYVPDASNNTIKVYEPAVDLEDPVASIGGFESLTDASVAVDPTNGHLLVVDNAQPGFTHPQAVIREFDGAANPLGQLPGAPVHGAPSGIAVHPISGTLYVTDGNSEEANAYRYSAYGAGGGGGASAPAGEGPGEGLAGAAQEPVFSAGAGQGVTGSKRGPAKTSRSQTELVQKGQIRIAVSGGLTPTRLPRDGTAPITVQIGGEVTPLDPEQPPQLTKVRFAFNRAGRLDRRGLPQCGLSDIDPSNTRQALAACRDSLVGSGLFKAKVRLPEQSPFPSAGKVLAFNGNLKGKPVIFAHIFGKRPVPTSVVLPLYIREAKGTFGTLLDASLAELTGDWGYVTGLELKLGRKYSFKGERHSFLSAGCPAPKGFPGALFPLAKTSFSFVGGRTLSATLTRSCKVRG